jgi:hypothetical protein
MPPASDNAVFRALIARHNPVLEEYLAQARREECLATVRGNIFDLLEDRGLALDQFQRARIESCDDLAMLERWLLRTIKVESAAALLD